MYYMKGCIFMNCYIIGQKLTFNAEEIVFNRIQLLIHLGIKKFYSRGTNDFEKLCEKAIESYGAKIILVKEFNVADCDAVVCNFYDCKEGEKYLGEIDETKKLIINIAL